VNGFADSATLLDHGVVRFAGSVSALAGLAGSRQYVLELRESDHSLADLNDLLGSRGRLHLDRNGDHVLAIGPATRLGEVLVGLEAAGAAVVDCRERRQRLEAVFLDLTERPS
jgi:hypothetical protein